MPEGELPALPTMDAAELANRVEELANELDQVQFSSASGFQTLREIRVRLRELIADARGEMPPLDEEINS